jgi:hypothetical protein
LVQRFGRMIVGVTTKGTCFYTFSARGISFQSNVLTGFSQPQLNTILLIWNKSEMVKRCL